MADESQPIPKTAGEQVPGYRQSFSVKRATAGDLKLKSRDLRQLCPWRAVGTNAKTRLQHLFPGRATTFLSGYNHMYLKTR
jgi:hypothetical protein